MRNLLPLLLLLCSANAAAQRSDTIVRQAGMPRYPGVASAVETLSIGTVDGPREYTFTDITDIAIGTDGSMLILDAPFLGTAAIRLYDVRGRHVRNVGRIGDGPGEYRRPAAVATMPDGRLLVLDAMNRRILVYSSSGEYADTWSIPFYRVSTGGRPPMRVDRAGIIAIVVQLTPRPPIVEGIVRLRPGGTVIDTLMQPELPDLYRSVTISSTSGTTRVHTTLALPYTPGSRWSWSPLGYFVTGVTNKYAIDLRLPSRGDDQAGRPVAWRKGDSVVSLRVATPAVDVSPAEHNDRTRFVARQLDEMKGERSGSMPPVPRQKPFFRNVRAGEDGRIWVTIHAPSERFSPPEYRTPDGRIIPQIGWREPVVLDVLEVNGTYVGRVRLPFGVNPLAFRGDEIWAFTRDEFDVPYVKRFRVRWGS